MSKAYDKYFHKKKCVDMPVILIICINYMQKIFNYISTNLIFSKITFSQDFTSVLVIVVIHIVVSILLKYEHG